MVSQKEEIKRQVRGREREEEWEGMRKETCRSRWALVRPVPLLHGGFLLRKLTSFFTPCRKVTQHPKFKISIQKFLLFAPFSNFSPYLTHRSSKINMSISVSHPSLAYRQPLRLYSFFYTLLCGYLQSYVVNIQNLISVSVFIKGSFVLGIYGGIIQMFGSILSNFKAISCSCLEGHWLCLLLME